MKTTEDWALQLYSKSVLKQQKFREIEAMLGEVNGRRCLDLGSDNGVISLLLRRKGGRWVSADLAGQAVQSIRSVVKHHVHEMIGHELPFADQEFERVVIVDMLEHVKDDRAFLAEVTRILKPKGELIINVPNIKNTFLRKLRLAVGLTDEKHGHVRPGYTAESLKQLVQEEFQMLKVKTYSKFFSEFIDTIINLAVEKVKNKKTISREKGVIVTNKDLNQHRKLLAVYSLIYPFLWLLSKLDTLLFFREGYVLLMKARKSSDEGIHVA